MCLELARVMRAVPDWSSSKVWLNVIIQSRRVEAFLYSDGYFKWRNVRYIPFSMSC